MQAPASPPASSRRAASACSSTSARGLTGYVLFDQTYIQYLTGFGFLSNERPIAFAQSAAGELAVFVPEFEVERTRAETDVRAHRVVPGVPGHRASDADLRARRSRTSASADRIGADQDGYPGILGYQGPALSEVTGASVTPLAPEIEREMARKSPPRSS